MKAILELNQFQRIIDILRPEPYLKFYYINPAEIFSFTSEDEPSSLGIDRNVITFKLEGQLGEFLLYKYCG